MTPNTPQEESDPTTRWSGRLFTAAALVLAIAGCATSFRSGFSMRNDRMFLELPRIVDEGERCALRWRYADNSFYFSPQHKVVDGVLLFVLPVTTSTGDMTGRTGEVLITSPEELAALRSGGAYWVEPGGERLPLEVVHGEED